MCAYETKVYLDEGGDSLIVASGGKIDVQSGGELELSSGATMDFDAALDIDNTLTVGEDGTGYDVKFFGDTSGTYVLWDEDVDSLLLIGTAAKARLGTFASSEAGSGSALSADNTAALRVYTDDGGAAISSGQFVRSIVGRNLQTYTSGNREQESAGVVGQIVSVGGTNRHNMCGVMGSYEAKTTLTVGGQAAATDTWCQAGVIGRVGMSSGTLTVDTNAVLAGVAAMSNINTAVTQTYTGVYAAFYAGAWASTDDWEYGLYIEQDKVSDAGIYVGSGATYGIDCQGKARIGTHDWGVGSTGIELDGTDPDMVFQVAGMIDGTLGAAAYAAAYTQLAITATQSANVSAFASWNELYITGGTIDLSGSSNYAGCWGHVEIAGTVTTPGGIGHVSGLWGTIVSPSTLTNAAVLAGCVVTSDITTGLTNNGVMAGYACLTDSGKQSWEHALYIDGADTVIGVASGTNYEDGIKITSTVAGESSHDVNADGLLKIDVGGTSYYIPIFGAAKVTNE
jgi:hypothetical protein